jgi:hypothetical protein
VCSEDTFDAREIALASRISNLEGLIGSLTLNLPLACDRGRTSGVIRLPVADEECKFRLMEDAVKEEIFIDSVLCAILLKAGYDESGIRFFTSNDLSQQLASMSYKPGKIIAAHTHQPVRREVLYTQEALFIRKGKLRVDFYSAEQEYRLSRILKTGDVILLISGGHGFEVLEELNMVEVKQGPYAGDKDKLVFSAAVPVKIKFE